VAAEASVAVVAAVGAGNRMNSRADDGSNEMKSATSSSQPKLVPMILAAMLICTGLCAASVAQEPKAPANPPPAGSAVQTFDTPQLAADALVKAAADFDAMALINIFGEDGREIAFTGEFPQDRKHAADFAQQAQEKLSVSVDPKSASRAFVLVGKEDWPFPVPLVKKGARWSFDSKAGRRELLYRRIGSNELDAIQICHGYVEAQVAYSLEPREGYNVNQYAQRIISTPGTKDGLAWQNSDGTWGGPIGEKIAEAIELGYNLKSEPYHGYFFKILKGQGPAAPLGQMNFVVENVMIGGFALVAAPAEYGVTGVQTFIVSHDGVLYQKDLGPKTLDEFSKMELFNPDRSWTPVIDHETAIPLSLPPLGRVDSAPNGISVLLNGPNLLRGEFNSECRLCHLQIAF
jgi:hypothetical protein